jgi:prophage antirepressor-like protein
MGYTEMENNEMGLQVINEQEVLGKQFRVYGTFEEPLFLAKDVAEWIDNKNVSQMLNVVDDDEKLIYTLYMSGQNREMWFLTEDGLYEVLMQSRKPIAKQFKKQVKAILKGLRKGEITLVPSYMIADPIERAKRWIEEQEEKKRLENTIMEQAPKVDFFDSFMNTSTTFNATQVAKVLNIKSARKLNEILHENGLIYRQEKSKKWFAYANVDNTWFKTVVNEYGTQLRITAKGIIEISKLLNIQLTQDDLESLLLGVEI